MADNAKIAPVNPRAVSPASSALAQNGFRSAPRQTASQDAAAGRYRLVIEEGPAGSFIYKTLDRMTGEVIRQFPREQVVKMMGFANYGAGAVIDTSA